MAERLQDIASIRTGFYAKHFDEGEAYYIQASDVISGQLSSMKPTIQFDRSARKHLLEDGDILIPSKGNDNRAFLYNEQVSPAVASSIFMVLRIHDQRAILPAYLRWYISSSPIQRMLGRMSKGTRIASLSKKSLAELEIDVPDMATQKRISSLVRLEEFRHELSQEIDRLKALALETQLMNLVQERS